MITKNSHKHSIVLVNNKLQDVQSDISVKKNEIGSLQQQIDRLKVQENEYQSAKCVLEADILGSLESEKS